MLDSMKNRVAERRRQLEISQTKLAEMCGVSRQTIHAVETAKYQPSVTLALKLAKCLDAEVERLFTLEKGD